jgi:hypothetical protein
MDRKSRVLLWVDATVNLILGAALLLSPAGLAGLLGLPPANTYFYASILGAVLFGIGAALVVEVLGARRGNHGLAIPGAIAINLCGGGALAAWLAFGSLPIPLRGHVVLWTVAAVVLAVGAAELIARPWKTR